MLQDETAILFQDVYNNNPFEGYYFFEPLKNFTKKNKSSVEEWFKKKLKIIIECTNKSGLTLLSK